MTPLALTALDSTASAIGSTDSQETYLDQLSCASSENSVHNPSLVGVATPYLLP
jgi:hypothetical protein